MEKKTIKDLECNNKRVLVRVDFNVPLKDGVIEDDNRIVQAVPTISYLLQQGAKVILMSHLGRPEGKANKKYSLKPCAERLSELLGQPVKMSDQVVGAKTTKLVNSLKSGEVALLENVRFKKQEEENDPEFAKKLAELGDIFVNDAFGTAHRKHASTYGVAKLLPNAVGFLIEKELNMIVKNIEEPVRPLTAILGGAKVSDKITIVEKLLDKVDNLIIGGAMAYTFLKAQGVNVGKSLVEDEMLEVASKTLQQAVDKQVNLFLPLDHIMTDNIKTPSVVTKSIAQNIDANLLGADIGPKTRKLFAKVIKNSATVIWNGPMGVFEEKPFEKGTKQIAKALAKSKAISIVGGGDSASAVIHFGYANKISHISTGGGASLKLFEGKVLPCVDVIEDKK